MIQLPISVRARLCALFAAARSAVCLSRLLLLLIAIEAITMPITQGIWSWDRFLHGGQDFELGLLIIVTCLCLVLLRVQQNRSSFGWLVLIWTFLLRILKQNGTSLLTIPRSVEHRTRIPSHLSLASVNLPLLI